ncbi:pyridoxamine 5'-phosphate oxidase family protein [Actinomadura flavalba]|uniref:pyridoxamine 5'-phosphate oxidase family protein n=1 Tax=Actinomadura flavalba TaxID=1120938 RepID=UPI000361D1FF|nr:pyridoxamine 5'-phosphate oxidase family protein [Actinomadura flavalba]
MTSLSTTERTRLRRGKDRALTSRDALHAVLDEGRICHLGVVVDGAPRVLPTGYGRIGETLYLHGSSGSASLLGASSGEICVTVTLLDGFVLARSAFHHSVNYRSAVVYGRPRVVTDPAEKLAALEALTESMAPGRWAATRPPTRKELAATTVLALPLDEASVKARSGPPVDDEEDYALPVWAGVMPVRTSYGPAEPDPRLEPGPAAPSW